ncbi:MAG TPA: lytic murein transglycosylase, partial [Solirubrobacterales bacterium]|nr:lytic murein transglycosylase [Solirubrobacterales bacterium]
MRSTSSSAPWLIVAIPAGLIAALIALLLAFAVIAGGASGCGESEAVGALGSEVPKRLVPIYEEAAAKYDLGVRGPSVLASINFHETSFGTNLGDSSAGAEGWMQFLPSSWEAFGVDGDEDGDRDPSDPWDAIFAAANLLHHEGAPGDWWGAIWHYNHADWYVEEVLREAKKFASPGGTTVAVAAGGCEAAALAPNEAVAKMIAEADRLSAIRPQTEYVWGGSHGESPTPANGPFDCSSAVSHLLQVAGFDNPTMDTIALLSWAEPGPGEWV